MRIQAWVQCIVFGGVIMFGGPYLVNAITPTEEEIRKRYNPELRKRSLAERDQKIAEANEFINKLKEYSKSDKPIWTVMKEEELKEKKKRKAKENERKRETQNIAEEIRRQRMQEES